MFLCTDSLNRFIDEVVKMSRMVIRERLQGEMIAVIRSDETDFAVELCRTILGTGWRTIEVTFTIPHATRVISLIKETVPTAVIGAGTVLSVKQADEAIRAGADFLVTPCLIDGVGEFCREKGIFSVLGAMTPTEAYQAFLAGSDAVKLFPSDQLGPKFMRALLQPFPHIAFIPTGGIDPTNVKKWMDLGAFAVGIGSYLTQGIQRSHLNEVESRCNLIVQSLKGN